MPNTNLRIKEKKLNVLFLNLCYKENMSQTLITIARYASPVEAELAKTKLESEEIAVFLADLHTISIQNFWSAALGGIRLQVLKQDEKRAKEILNLD